MPHLNGKLTPPGPMRCLLGTGTFQYPSTSTNADTVMVHNGFFSASAIFVSFKKRLKVEKCLFFAQKTTLSKKGSNTIIVVTIKKNLFAAECRVLRQEATGVSPGHNELMIPFQRHLSQKSAKPLADLVL